MQYTPDGFLGQVWQKEQEDGSILSLLLPRVGGWELARIVGGKVQGQPEWLSDENARKVLDSFEEGAGRAFFVAEAQAVVDKRRDGVAEAEAHLSCALKRLAEVGKDMPRH